MFANLFSLRIGTLSSHDDVCKRRNMGLTVLPLIKGTAKEKQDNEK
jgi:hypothetical protein